MSAQSSASVLDRPLRRDLASFFTVGRCAASACAASPEAPLVGVLAELARYGRT
jgi:hypothetical protein